MKKLFIFAIAAATMAVGCQKLQGVLLNPNNPSVDENDPVEIKFNTNIAVVETKVASLDGLTLKVYGINGTDSESERQFFNIDATAAGAGVTDPATLTLVGAPYFYDGNKDKYSFYGYYLDGANIDAEPVADPYQANLTITGKEDVLVASAPENGNYSAEEARKGNHPNLVFTHALSQFKFSAINLGGSEMKLTGVAVKTPLNGTITVVGATTGVVAGTLGETDNIDVAMDDLTLPVGGSDYLPVAVGADASAVMVFPATTYDFYFTLEQGTETRTLKVSVSDAIAAATSYMFKVKLYSLEEIEITATLVDWTTAEIEIDTDNAEEI